MKERIRVGDGTTHPIITADDELGWRCYHTPLSDYDKKRCGGFIAAYMALVNMPLSHSRKRLAMIKKALREPNND